MSIINLTSWIIVIAFVLAMVHFVYEAAILPCIREHLRFRLFALRDRLRTLKSEITIQQAAFEALDEGISRQIRHQHRLTLSLLVEMERMERRDPEFRASVESVASALDSCQVDEFQEIRKLATKHMIEAVVYNGVIWYFPLGLLVMLWNTWMTKLKNAKEAMVLAPRKQFDAISNAQPA